MNDFSVIRRGRWSTDGASGFVWIVRQTWDYYHEEFYDDGPDLNEEGLAYYALFGVVEDIAQHLSRSRSCLSEDEVVRVAEQTVTSIVWEPG